MAHTLGALAEVLDCSIDEQWKAAPIAHLAFDSRRLLYPRQTLFVALTSGQNDGHRYISQAYQAGVRVFLVQKEAALPLLEHVCWLPVPDTLRAMQALATYHRELFTYPVVGITGSNGKTIIKEWLHQLLQEDFSVVRTPKSYNSQIGVPLSVWGMAGHHNLGLFEAGISQPDEMIHLARIIQPTLGIFSTIGPAHDEGFSSRAEKIREKLILFHEAEALVYCLDHTAIAEAVDEQLPPKVRRLTWGRSASAALRMLSSIEQDNHTSITLTWQGEEQVVHIPFTDAASCENALHCIRLLLHLGYTWARIEERLQELHHIPMRLELKQAQQNSLLIYDCYNSDIKSLEIALDFLERHHSGRQRVVILSDIQQSGQPADELYRQLAEQLRHREVDRLIGVGPALTMHGEPLPVKEKQFFPDTTALLKALPELALHDCAILLKGARAFAFERVGERLEQHLHATVFEINLNALAHNLKVYQRQIPEGVKTMAMVKAFSYGAGSYEIASVLAYHQVDYLAVAYPEEGVALRKAQVTLPIMVINPDRSNLSQLWAYNLEPEVYSLSLLEAILAESQGQPTRIHLMLDTGMHRLGLVAEDIPKVIEGLQRHPEVEVATLLSHLVGSDDPRHDAFTHRQAQLFTAWSDQIMNGLPNRPLRHLLNSGGIVRFPQYTFDMVRLGLGLYGLDTTEGVQDQLEPIGRLKTVVSQVKHIPAGDTIGYDRATKVKRDAVLATVAIGYADGYRRAFSQGKGYMLVHGQPAPVLGNVCMDLTMLDITDIPNVKEGDEVIVFGPELPVQTLARQAQTIPYEIISSIDQRVKRVYVEE